MQLIADICRLSCGRIVRQCGHLLFNLSRVQQQAVDRNQGSKGRKQGQQHRIGHPACDKENVALRHFAPRANKDVLPARHRDMLRGRGRASPVLLRGWLLVYARDTIASSSRFNLSSRGDEVVKHFLCGRRMNATLNGNGQHRSNGSASSSLCRRTGYRHVISATAKMVLFRVSLYVVIETGCLQPG